MYCNKINVFCLESAFIALQKRAARYQHCGAKIKLFIELSDKDVSHQEIVSVLIFCLSNHVGHPLKVLLSSSDP